MKSIQAKKVKIVNNEALIVTVDIGKAKNPLPWSIQTGKR